MHPKPFKTIDELYALLVVERGLRCANSTDLKTFLEKTNYYRFSGYAREFQRDPKHGDNSFVGGVLFEEVKELIDMDSQLRRLLLIQLGAIEIAIRAKFAHEYGRTYGEDTFYLRLNSYRDGDDSLRDRPREIVQGILSDLSRDKSRMIKRYEDNSILGEDLQSRSSRFRSVPIWVAVEVLSFGRISNMISYVNDIEPARRVTESLSVQWTPFADVVHSFSVLRNLCAHHRQLWNRRMDIQCPVQKNLRPRNIKYHPSSVFASIILANHYRLKIDGNTSVASEILNLINQNEKFAEGVYFPNPK